MRDPEAEAGLILSSGQMVKVCEKQVVGLDKFIALNKFKRQEVYKTKLLYQKALRLMRKDKFKAAKQLIEGERVEIKRSFNRQCSNL